MDLNFLTDFGTELIKKPKFQKFLGETSAEVLNSELSNITSELNSLENEIKESATSGIGIDKDDSPEDKNLTREERRNNRLLRKENRKKRREEKREELKRKREKLKQRIIPRFEEYTVKGRIYDSNTATPLKGVEVKPGVDLTQGEGLDVDPGVATPEELKGALNTDIQLAADFRVYVPVEVLVATNVDDSLRGRERRQARRESRKITTNDQGYYEFKVKALVIGEEDEDNTGLEKRELVSILDLGLVFNKEGYIPSTTSIITLDNRIKRDINTIGLVNVDKAAEDTKKTINNAIYLAGLKAQQLFLSAIEKIIVARKKSVQNVTNLLTSKLIPLLIGILIIFGISKLSQKNLAKCPSPDQLKEAIRRRNRTVKQINQVFKAVIINTGLATVFIILAAKLKEIRFSIDSLPIPMSVGTPPAKDFGGLIASVKYSTIAKLQNINDLLEELEEQNKELNKNLLIALAFLIAGLIIARLLLKNIDELVSKCAQDQIDSGEIVLEELTKEIDQLGDEEEEQIEPFINGFDLSVVEVDKEIGSIKRRQAIAKNKDGVIVLKGEPSFSATDQVLIDELAFYIKSNNLKAF